MIRKAKKADADNINKLFKQAIAYFKAKGIDQWQHGYPDLIDILDDIDKGCGYVQLIDNRIIGYSAIVLDGDPNYKVIYDGQWLNDESYGAIHRIVIDESCKGQGLASNFFAYAKDLCIENEIYNLRVDTHKDNHSMQHLIMKNGFSKCGIIYVEDGTPRYAYQNVFTDMKK